MRNEEGTFPSSGETLFRRSISPPDPRATLAIIHGYGDHSGRFVHFMRWLAERGLAIHGFDLRGQGRSTGRHGYVRRWSDYLDDLTAFLALPELAARPLFILGHSHGGLILAAAGELGLLPDVQGCVFSSPFLRSRLHVPWTKRLLARLANPILPWLPVTSGLNNQMMSSDPAMIADSTADPLIRRVGTPRWFLEMTRVQQRVLAQADAFSLPMLMLTGDADPIADPAAAAEFVRNAGAPDKSQRSYPAFLHELLRERNRKAVFEDILQWIEARITVPSLSAKAVS